VPAAFAAIACWTLTTTFVPPAKASVAPVVEVAFVPPVSLWGWENPRKDVYGVDVNVIYDRARNVYGASVGTYMVVDRDFWGVSANAIGCQVDGKVRGLQLSGFYNRAEGDFIGLQASLMKNVLTGYSAFGVQIALAKNESLADFNGVQLAGFVNETSGFEANGIFLSGIMNWDDAEVTTGLQVAPMNWKTGRFHGIQVGVVNAVSDSAKVGRSNAYDFVPYGDVVGVQLGLVNIGGWVRGLQIGLINYASTLSGLQVGAINVAPGKGSLTFFPGVNPGFATERGS
jgi:hypothetical protein